MNALLLLLLALAPALYKVDIDNAWVHVLRETVAPHEKSPVHSHPATVVVYLTATRGHHAGDVTYNEPGMHSEENISDRPAEAIVIELKTGATPSPQHAVVRIAADDRLGASGAGMWPSRRCSSGRGSDSFDLT